MYIFPNKKPIKIKKLERAFRDPSHNKKYYLDSITGNIVSGKGINVSENILNELRFFEVPKLSSETQLKWMREFIDNMLWGDSPDLAEDLEKALSGQKPTEDFMKILSLHESGWIHGWVQWENDFLWEEITDWFCSLPIEIEDDMSELDDDCPLCRLMKEGNSSIKNLEEAFRKAKESGMHVGGDLFEK